MNSKLKPIIRQETQEDHTIVFHLITEAFASLQLSDHREQFLVERLRKSDAFVPELSMVAVVDDQVVGHILLTKLEIKNEKDIFPSLGLAPVAVLPSFQGKGIGGALIKQAHKTAVALGYKSIVLLGHKDYYPRFGYQRADSFGIALPFDVPKEHCMAIALVEDGLKGVSGMVEYPREFGE